MGGITAGWLIAVEWQSIRWLATGGFGLAFHRHGELVSGFYYIWASHLLQVSLPLAAAVLLVARRVRAATWCLAVLGWNAAYSHLVFYATREWLTAMWPQICLSLLTIVVTTHALWRAPQNGSK